PTSLPSAADSSLSKWTPIRRHSIFVATSHTARRATARRLHPRFFAVGFYVRRRGFPLAPGCPAKSSALSTVIAVRVLPSSACLRSLSSRFVKVWVLTLLD